MTEAAVDFEAALITAIIDTKDIRTVIKHKITADYLFDPTSKAAFIFLLQWYNNPQYGDVPSWESFSTHFNGFTPNRVDESIIALCDNIRRVKLYSDIAGLMDEVIEVTPSDPAAGFELLKKKVVGLTAAHTVDNTSTVNSSISELREEYMNMKAGGSKALKGYPYPWDAMNDSTLGLQNQQLVFIYGRPKTKKTWLLLEMARVLHKIGLRPIIFSQELSDIEIKRRFVALSTRVNYHQFLRGQLPEKIELDFLDDLDAFMETEEVPVSRLSAMGEGCLTELNAKIDEYKANVVLIDGVNYLSTDWKELAEITRGLKRICQAKGVPIVGSTHANRSRKKGADIQETADDFSYGDAFYQTCDAAIRVTCDIEDYKAKQVRLFTAALREGQPVLFTVNAHLAENLSQKAVEKMGDPNDVDGEIEQDEHDAKMDGASDLPEEADVA